MNRLVILLLILSPIFSHAQKRLDLIHDNAFAFFDYQEKAFCVLDDSTFIWKYDATKIKWQKKPIELSIDMPFAKFLAEFIPMSDNGTPVYFVHCGCGVVYFLDNNIISRHDNSFYHLNQLGGAYFIDNGEPRIYGGYGLFTSKNIITRYDTIEKEWFVIEYNNPPPPGVKNIIKRNKKNYFVLDGFQGFYSQYKVFKDLWRYNVETKKWTNLGRVNPTILGKQIELNYENSQIQDNLYACFPNMIIVYDFDKLRFRKYKPITYGLYRKIINIGDLFLILKTKSKPSRYVEITNSDFLKQLELEEGDILLKEPSLMDQFRWLIRFSLLLLGILIITLFTKNSKRKNQLISSNQQTNNALFDEFSSTEKELIRLLIQFNETGIEISHINDLVNHDQPSIDTLKKRRETLLKELRYKIAVKFNIPQEEIFIEERMVSDKRMKLLFLNQLVILKFKIPSNS